MKKISAIIAALILALAAPLFAAPEVAVISPSDGAECQAGKPLEVGFAAKGGPFTVFRITADTAGFITEAPGTDQLEAKGVLIWKDPQPGKHELTVSAYDMNKEEATARVRVIVEESVQLAAPPPNAASAPVPAPEQAADDKAAAEQAQIENESAATPEPKAQPAIPVFNLKILSPADGSVVDAVPSEKGFYECSVEFEASGSMFRKFGLEADGILMSYVNTPDEPDHARLKLPWWPVRGNGRYELTVYADPIKEYYGRRTAAKTIVDVRGIPPDAATPQNRIIVFYREKWGIDVPSAPIGRFYDISKTVSNHWISTAYMRDCLYVVILSDNANDLSGWKHPLGRPSAPGAGELCPFIRPAGALDILLAFIDFGGTDITRGDIEAFAPRLNREVNDWHERFAREHGLKGPNMTFRVTCAYGKAKPSSEVRYSLKDIREMTGVDPAGFNIVAQVDLSAKNRSVEIEKGTAGGMAYWGALGTKPPSTVDMWCAIQGKAGLENLRGTLLDHELAHLMGWQH
ncbi:MAG TPA: hypothetical protein P5287_06800, partial [bacterium]|nr:hypothetical protein [bacterium]